MQWCLQHILRQAQDERVGREAWGFASPPDQKRTVPSTPKVRGALKLP